MFNNLNEPPLAIFNFLFFLKSYDLTVMKKSDQNYNLQELTDYWNEYYSKKKELLPNSNFSEFALDHIQKNQTLIDIGCGDGRDAVFFGKNEIITTGVDISEMVIAQNKSLEHDYLKFSMLNIENINDYKYKYDYAYCRFLFHAVDEKIEDKLLIWLKNNIKELIFIETRIRDEEKSNIEESHYRRYFSEENFIFKIQKNGFNIKYSESSRSFSKYKHIYNVNDLKDDPLLLRIVIENN